MSTNHLLIYLNINTCAHCTSQHCIYRLTDNSFDHKFISEKIKDLLITAPGVEGKVSKFLIRNFFNVLKTNLMLVFGCLRSLDQTAGSCCSDAAGGEGAKCERERRGSG